MRQVEQERKAAAEAQADAKAATDAKNAADKAPPLADAGKPAADAQAAADKAAADAKALADKAAPEGKGSVGLGVKPVMSGGKQTGLNVSRLVDGGCAQRSGGISVGDSLLTVDGVDVTVMSIKDLAAKALAGAAGAPVTLGFEREGGRRYEVTLVRDAV